MLIGCFEAIGTAYQISVDAADLTATAGIRNVGNRLAKMPTDQQGLSHSVASPPLLLDRTDRNRLREAVHERSTPGRDQSGRLLMSSGAVEACLGEPVRPEAGGPWPARPGGVELRRLPCGGRMEIPGRCGRDIVARI
ncbi:hypothetical protein [Streptomyces lateritius]|uniref:hypothetical protein n=1 Tax=Streptomyces lateritius TaxID=67313 RepID=UPI001671E46E|nr:hypothetical protein [Streptomyces lateritius]GGT72303.1 hypothetical protein GCM10010272_14290 [Streptomyces lateritius]